MNKKFECYCTFLVEMMEKYASLLLLDYLNNIVL